MEKEPNWFPIESNPEIFNSYAKELGIDCLKYEWYDVYSTDDWALEMVP